MKEAIIKNIIKPKKEFTKILLFDFESPNHKYLKLIVFLFKKKLNKLIKILPN